MNCHKCGLKLRNGAAFCSSCGEKVEQQQQQNTQQQEELNDERRAKMVSGTSNALGGVGRAVGSWVGALVKGTKDGWNSESPNPKDADEKK
ncbi:MAG: zinc ribbon domain-containing protein [Treponema sp.]|nr:zinc ribbon domain-containing protein [Treponema sp.]